MMNAFGGRGSLSFDELFLLTEPATCNLRLSGWHGDGVTASDGMDPIGIRVTELVGRKSLQAH